MGTSQTNEQALESAIEKKLTGACLEELRAQQGPGNITERAEIFGSFAKAWMWMMHILPCCILCH